MRHRPMTWMTVSLLAILMAAGAAFARPGGGPGGPGGHRPDGPPPPPEDRPPLSEVGTPFAVDGTVTDIIRGRAVVLTTADGEMIVGGLPPKFFYETQDAAPPEVDDAMAAEGYSVTFRGKTRNIAVTVTVNGQTLAIRDPETGRPLWSPEDRFQIILTGTPFDYTGTLIDRLPRGGIILTTDAAGDVTVVGLAPLPYWRHLEVQPPEIGDTVTVTGYTVELGGESRNIAMTVTVNGESIQLRDPDTGAPLWRVRIQGGPPEI
jgi:hypothetical protein